MGRRALGKWDKTLDLSKHLVLWDDLPSIWSQRPMFDVSQPLEVEIGTGKGLFLKNAAIAVPERNFLVIEISRKYARFSAAKLARHDLKNACVVHADGQRVFCENIPTDALVAVHIYFPDPWWKKRHHKRRIMTESFVGEIARTLKPGGRLHFWTDVAQVFQNALEVLANESALSGPEKVVPQEAEHDLDYRTHFERRMRLSGVEIHRVEFIKK